MAMKTSSQNTTYLIDRHATWGCHVEEMTHYGQSGTGFLWCSTHGELAGEIIPAGGWR